MGYEEKKRELLSIIDKLENIKKEYIENFEILEKVKKEEYIEKEHIDAIEKMEKEYREKIENIQKEKDEKRNILEASRRRKNKQQLFYLYFRLKIKLEPNGIVRSIDLLDRINKFIKPVNIKLTRDELSKFMEENGIKEEKLGESKCFVGIDHIEKNLADYIDYIDDL